MTLCVSHAQIHLLVVFVRCLIHQYAMSIYKNRHKNRKETKRAIPIAIHWLLHNSKCNLFLQRMHRTISRHYEHIVRTHSSKYYFHFFFILLFWCVCARLLTWNVLRFDAIAIYIANHNISIWPCIYACLLRGFQFFGINTENILINTLRKCKYVFVCCVCLFVRSGMQFLFQRFPCE